jgi:hypothetical protein
MGLMQLVSKEVCVQELQLLPEWSCVDWWTSSIKICILSLNNRFVLIMVVDNQMVKETIFKVGEKVIFSPDDNAIAYSYYSFRSWGLYPGKIIIVKGVRSGEGIYSSIPLLQVPSGEWILSNQFIPFKENEKCNFQVNDIVRFYPSDRTWQKSPGRIGNLGVVKVNHDYTVRRIVNDIWIFADNDVNGFYWTDFTLVKKAESKKLPSSKSVKELVGEVLSYFNDSKKDKDITYAEKSLIKDVADLKSGKEELIRDALIRIEYRAMGEIERRIQLKLRPKNILANKKRWNAEYQNTMYELYWAARRINDSIKILK